MKFGISEKVIFLFILLVTILGMVLGFYFLRNQRKTLLLEFDERVEVLLNSLAVSSEYPVLIADIKTLDRIGKGVLRQKNVVFCEIRDKEGEILFQGGSKKEKDIRQYSASILTEKIAESWGEELILGFKKKETEEIGKIYLTLSLAGLIERLSKVKKIIGLSLLVGIIIAFLFISLLIRLILGRPINELIRGIKIISAGNLSYKVPVKAKDEIGMLAASFNKMTEYLHQTTTSIDNLNQEIIERNKAEAALKNVLSEWQITFDSAKDAIMLLNNEFKIIRANFAIAKFLGKPLNEILSKYCYQLFHGTSSPPAECPFEMMKKIKKREERKLYLPEKDVWISVTVDPVVDAQGSIISAVHIIRDITGQKKAEQEREALINTLEERQELLKRQKQEVEDSRKAIKNVVEDLKKSNEMLEEKKEDLEKINTELDDFTYIVSHDLKEPLRSIDAFTKFITDDYKDKLKEEEQNYLERIRVNAARMQNLIEDLLEISRLERIKSPFEEVAVDELIDEVKLRLEYAIREKDAEIIISGKLPRVFCDRVRFTEIFINLVSNAIKFADKKPLIEIGCEQKDGLYEFYVKDNGPGIEEQYFNKIFEIFQRLGRREDKEGTGAGLTIVKKIIQMHKGKIWVESKVGEGTTFYFTLPKEKEDIAGKKKIGQILIEKKLVAQEDVQKALDEQEGMA